MMTQRIRQNILNLLWILLVASSVLVATDRVNDGIISPKWYAMIFACAVVSLVLSYLVYMMEKLSWGELYKKICISTNVITLIEASLFLISYTSMFTPYISIWSLGGFNNVTGFVSCLSLTYPMGLLLFRSLKLYQKIVVIGSKVITPIAIFVCESRAGFICIIGALLFVFCYHRKIRIQTAIITIISTIIICISFVKTESSEGRRFILFRSIDMIKKHPFSGWGYDGFRRHYMDIQAAYFSSCPKSGYGHLADNIHHPLNEYLLIAVNYGIPMLFICICCLFLVFLYYARHINIYSTEGFMTFLSIAVYAFFSYIFSYPFTYLVLCLSLFVIFAPSLRKTLFRKLTLLLLLVSDISIAHGALPFSQRLHYLLEWNRASQQDDPNVSIKRYGNLYTPLNYNYRFLYDYACVAYNLGHYKKALAISKEAALLISDYNLTLLIADIYNSLSDKEKAISLYNHAHNMCPSRLVPYYEIYKIYSSMNDTLNCCRIYQELGRVPIKINNYQNDIMLNEIHKDIQRYNYYH